jgi:hypothetical protein
MRPPQYGGDIFATNLVARPDLCEMIGHMTGRGSENVTAEGFIRADVAQQVTGWE